MECPTCGGEDLQPEDGGMLVCQDCADRFPDYRDEEVDEALAGTAVSNRTSQASQAMIVRTRIEAAKREEEEKRKVSSKSAPDEELVFCEAVLAVTKGIAQALVRTGVYDARIYDPLRQILTHWVRARHAMVPIRQARGKRGRKVEHRLWAKRFHCVHMLSLIALAGVFVRSPVLPSDLLRLIIMGKVPYFDAARLFLHEKTLDVSSVRDTLLPQTVPCVAYIKFGMVLHGTGEFAWPPLSSLFNGKRMLYDLPAVVSIPLGHLHLTLCRVIRELGLPDNFGKRVLRYIDLRKVARQALDKCSPTAPPKDFRNMQACDAKKGKGAFSWNPGPACDCSEWPTDRTLQIDIINTMRICYGHSNNHLQEGLCSLKSKNESHESAVSELEKEWFQAVKTMRRWYLTGGGNDATLTSWGTLSFPAISNLRGERLTRYLAYIKMVQGESEVPIFLRPHLRSFTNISQRSERPLKRPSASQRVNQTSRAWNWSSGHLKTKRTFGGVGEEAASLMSSGRELVHQLKDANQNPLLPIVHRGIVDYKLGEFHGWNEPAEFALAWTIMRHFFAGSPTSFTADRSRVSKGKEAKNFVETADRSLGMVLDYINIKLGGSIHRRKRRRLYADDKERAGSDEGVIMVPDSDDDGVIILDSE